MRLLPLLALLAAALGSAPTRAQPAGETIVILDLSGSMWGRIGQETKLDIAREAVRGMFSRFPADSRVGLMAFGHRQARACNDIEMLVPPGPVDQAAVDGVLGRLTARGRTPLTDSVREAA